MTPEQTINQINILIDKLKGHVECYEDGLINGREMMHKSIDEATRYLVVMTK